MPDKGIYYAVTGSSGGYAIPILSPGNYQVAFSGQGIPEGSSLAASIGSESVLLDFIPVRTGNKGMSMPWLYLLLKSN